MVFTYSFIGIGVFITVAGLIGCIGGCAESTCCLKTYIGLMIALLIIDISVAIAGYVQRQDVFYLMGDLWNEVNTETKNHIQTELHCCGYTNHTAEYGNNIPSSCYHQSNNGTTLYETNCEGAMKEWVQTKILIWASIVGSIGLIQILSCIFSCLTLSKVEKGMQVSSKPKSRSPRRKHQRQ